MIDEKKLKKILIRKGKDRLRLSTVINEIELMEKFDTDFYRSSIFLYRLSEDTKRMRKAAHIMLPVAMNHARHQIYM